MRFGSICPDRRAAVRIAAAVSLAAIGAVAAAQTTDVPGVYRTRTDLVVLQVTVTDRHRPVGGLRAENFSVYEEGAPQRIQMFATSDAPLDLMLLLDTSNSMEGRLELAKRAAIDLVGTLRPGDRVGVILFHTTAAFSHPLSDDHDGVLAAIRAAAPSGATAMYDAVYLGLHTLARTRRAQEEVRRQALIVLSDGADNSSRITFDHALDAARAGDATVFTIVPGLPQGASSGLTPPWPDGSLRFQLRRLAEDTGGRAFLAIAAGELEDIYEQIGGELRAQYWLAYEPTAIRPGFRRVSVRVTDPPGMQVRTRSGYTAGPPTGLGMRRAAAAP